MGQYVFICFQYYLKNGTIGNKFSCTSSSVASSSILRLFYACCLSSFFIVALSFLFLLFYLVSLTSFGLYNTSLLISISSCVCVRPQSRSFFLNRNWRHRGYIFLLHTPWKSFDENLNLTFLSEKVGTVRGTFQV